jgi:hypothetical protein
MARRRRASARPEGNRPQEDDCRRCSDGGEGGRRLAARARAFEYLVVGLGMERPAAALLGVGWYELPKR